MSATTPLAALGSRIPRLLSWARGPAQEVDLTPARRVLSLALSTLCGLLLLWALNLVVISHVEQYFAQSKLYAKLRLTLAEGATPIGPLTNTGALTSLGTPVAVMRDPAIGLSRGVVVQGSGPGQTMQGIGHVPDTVMPCQAGSSALMARKGAYGGIGDAWSGLEAGDTFKITMGQGTCTYRVLDLRVAGQQAPPPPTGAHGQLVLITATGAPYMPTGVLRIDATLVSKSFPAPAATVAPAAVPASQNPMGTDDSHLIELILLLQVLLAATLGSVWAWYRWGRWQTWIVATPILLTFGLLAAGSVNYLLPNLL